MRFAPLALLIIAAPACQSGAPAAGTVRIVAVGAANKNVAEGGSVGIDVGRVFFEEDEETRRFRLMVESMGTTLPGRIGGTDNPTDLSEVAIGGRLYGDYLPDLPVQPFASLQIVYAKTEDTSYFGFVPGTDQVGARLGAGLEWAITDQVFLDLVVDHTSSLTEDDTQPIFVDGIPIGSDETAFEGYAVRLGIGILF